MKKTILVAGAIAMAAVLVPTTSFAATSQQQGTTTFSVPAGTVQQAIMPEVAPPVGEYYFYFNNIPAGSYQTAYANDFYVGQTQHVYVRMGELNSSGTINANLYMVNASTGTAIRGPIKFTNTNTTYTFYDVPVGTYAMRIVNNGSYSITDGWGWATVWK